MAGVPSVRYLALGDSYSSGELVKPEESLPFQLASALKAAAVPSLEYPPTVVAKCAWSTAELLKAVDEVDLDGGYDLVTLLCGANDAYRGYETAVFTAAFRQMLAFAISQAKSPANVLVISTPDWTRTPFGSKCDRVQHQPLIPAQNAVERRLAADAGAHFCDILPASVAHCEEVMGDGLHPAPSQIAAWVGVALAAATAAARGEPPAAAAAETAPAE